VRNVRFFALLVASLAAVLGCGDDDDGGGSGSDGGARDATVVEAGASDAASPVDTGVLDAGEPRDAGAPTCPSTPCDVLESRTGCDVAEACVLGAGGPSCEPEESLTNLEAGEPCESALDCAAGLGCFRAGEGGTCAQICCPGRDAVCSGGLRCGRLGVLVDGTETSFGRCVGERPCDVLDSGSNCEIGEGCYVDLSSGNTDCRAEGDAEEDEPCEVSQDCRAGFVCTGLMRKTCQRLCDVTAELPCPNAEETCQRTISDLPEGIGLCAVL